MNIRIATLSDQRAWDNYVWDHPDAVAYHQFAWGQAVKNAYGFDPAYLIAVQGAEIIGVLPLIRLKVPLRGSCLVSLPYCDLGGVLADYESIAEALRDYAIHLANEEQHKKVELRQSAKSDAVDSANKVRMILQLPDTSEELMKGFKAKLRSQIRKPTKDGLTAELGGAELLADFYSIMTVNMRDLGSPVHSQRWFEQVVALYGENVRVGIVCSPEGKPIGGGIILLHNRSVSIPWASTLREYNRQNPNMLLYWTVLAFAADNGFKIFDFGRSTPGEGTYKFKQQWGAEPAPLKWCDLLSPESTQGAGGNSALRQKVESIWQKLPVGVSTILGSRLRRYIDL